MLSSLVPERRAGRRPGVRRNVQRSADDLHKRSPSIHMSHSMHVGRQFLRALGVAMAMPSQCILLFESSGMTRHRSADLQARYWVHARAACTLTLPSAVASSGFCGVCTAAQPPMVETVDTYAGRQWRSPPFYLSKTLPAAAGSGGAACLFYSGALMSQAPGAPSYRLCRVAQMRGHDGALVLHQPQLPRRAHCCGALCRRCRGAALLHRVCQHGLQRPHRLLQRCLEVSRVPVQPSQQQRREQVPCSKEKASNWQSWTRCGPGKAPIMSAAPTRPSAGCCCCCRHPPTCASEVGVHPWHPQAQLLPAAPCLRLRGGGQQRHIVLPPRQR